MEQLFVQLLEAVQVIGLLALLLGFIAYKFLGLIAGLLVKFLVKGVEIAFAYFALKFAKASHSLRVRRAQFLIAWRK